MGLFGDLVTNAMGGFPKKPEVPYAPSVSPQVAQTTAAKGNLATLPELESLADATNTFNVGQRRKMLDSAIPGYGKLTGQASDVLSGWLGGELSPDVASAVRRNANNRAFAGGYSGSGMADSLTARDLGLTSLDLQKMGVQSLNPYLATTGQLGMPQEFLPQSQFVSTPEQIAAEQWNETNRYGRDWLQNQLDSIPDPAQAAIAKDVGGMVDVGTGTAIQDVLAGLLSKPSTTYSAGAAADYGGELMSGAGGAGASGAGYSY